MRDRNKIDDGDNGAQADSLRGILGEHGPSEALFALKRVIHFLIRRKSAHWFGSMLPKALRPDY
jgi:hypothetical protein